MRLQEGDASNLITARVIPGGTLPPFRVQVVDAGGNCSSPPEGVPCQAVLACPAFDPTELVAACNDSGIAEISGA